MNDMYYLITIIGRRQSEKYIDFFRKNSVCVTLATLCNGTAQKKTLDYLGIENTEKLMLFAVASAENAKRIMRGLVGEMEIDVPGNGVAMTIPLESISSLGMKCLTCGQEILIEEGRGVMDNYQYSLIIAIAEKGYADLVMEAARSADARGGTIVHAKGTGAENMEKFFGVSIASEKEMLYIVVKKQSKSEVMKAIIANAGADSPAKSIVFSLPVDSVVGLRSLENE